jgi:hypothetical protein
MRKLLLVLFLVPSIAFGQAVTVKVDTIFTAMTVAIPQTITLQLVNSGVSIPGQSATITPSAPGWLFLNATFQSQPTQQTVTGVRVVFTLPPGNGWTQDSPWPLTAPIAITVPANNALTVAYNPLLGTLTATPNPPAVVAPPVNSATSAVPPSGTLTSSQGTWSFGTATGPGGNALLLNGANTGGGFGTKLYLTSGNVFTATAQHLCYQWTPNGTGGNWGSVALSNCP